jgi:hypothetical protein
VNRRVAREIKGLEKGDYVKVCWYDASDARGPLAEHKRPECLVDEWGVYLGVEGNPEHLLLGKHYVRSDHVWEATRIPTSLIKELTLVAKHAVGAVFLRRYQLAAPLSTKGNVCVGERLNG